LLAELDVDYLYVVSFDETFAKVTHEQFVLDILEQMNLHTVVVGFDFTFGHQGKGNAEFLRNFNSLSFSVAVVEPHLYSAEKVSSTRIRQLLAEGNVSSIPTLLGRHYNLIGAVRHGDGRGRNIGFPTANLELDGSYIFPKLGVYAVHATVNDKRYQAIVNIGVRPTFLAEPVIANVEVHLLDFDGDLYGETMSIELIQFIRAEQKFNGVDQLIEQIHCDIEVTRKLFSGKR
jgi:riboflavin kinase/FMN adenylyltransferase